MLWKRIVTSVVLIPVIWAAVWFSQEPIPWFTLAVAIWGLCALYEFYRIAVSSGKARPLTYIGLLLALGFIIQPHFDWPDSSQALLTLTVALPLVLVMLRRDKSTAFTGWAWTLAGVLYLGWLTSRYVALRELPYGREWVIFALFITFASDSSAYFVGRLLGRHKMAPNISPGKTWEGAAGGVAGAVAIGLLLAWITKLPISYFGAALLSIATSIAGQVGDLAESLFKRNTGVKDASNAIPGHGGFLDRIDSVVFAGLVVYYYALLGHGL